ncbi:DNA/RNA polymerase [Thozetella sp. PMI_491]|nr:DNA/RNA polymerase [Thozetella sp. PMI_491]
MDFSNPGRAKPPRRRDDRVILHFDYDCFYAQVIENQQPALKALPLGIKQKGILATCNYEARRRGVNKLMQIFEAKKICPELVLADGEDLSPFRDVSKRLYTLLRGYSWNDKVERLGLDEVFMDVTDLVVYNVDLLNLHALESSFFYLSQDDPTQGFAFDATSFAGCVHGTDSGPHDLHSECDVLRMRLLVASHLARHLRMKIEEEGYTSACGISTAKSLAKLAGNKNKPQNQTALLALQESDVLPFMDEHGLRKVPGIGAKTTRILESYVTGIEISPNLHTMDCSVTAGQVRTHPGMSPQLMDRLFSGPGSERGLGAKVWGLLHGVDDTEVKAGADVPTQISIEDTYKGLNEMAEINAELRKLSASLVRRMHVDLVEDSSVPHDGDTAGKRRWMAHPKTLRLSTAPKWSASDGKPYMFGRSSRSQPLPSFVFSFAVSPEEIVERLVTETLLGMFSKLNPEPGGWNVGMINVCVANMVPAGNETGVGSGRNIATMFRRQGDVLREFTVYDTSEPLGTGVERAPQLRSQPGYDDLPLDDDLLYLTAPNAMDTDDAEAIDEDDAWEEGDGASTDGELCPLCDHLIPMFALAAHDRFHKETA